VEPEFGIERVELGIPAVFVGCIDEPLFVDRLGIDGCGVPVIFMEEIFGKLDIVEFGLSCGTAGLKLEAGEFIKLEPKFILLPIVLLSILVSLKSLKKRHSKLLFNFDDKFIKINPVVGVLYILKT